MAETEPNLAVIPAITGHVDTSMSYQLFPEALQPYRPTILAYNASLLSTTIGFPLDTIKTRMQTHNYQSPIHCFRQTLAHEGIRGFFRGITAPLISTSISKSLSVSFYTVIKPVFSNIPFPQFKSKPHHTDTQTQLITALNNAPVAFASGFIAGGVVPLFACPFEFTKVYSQISKLVQEQHGTQLSQKLPTTTVGKMAQIVKIEGPFGLYSGLRLHFLRDSIASGFYFAFYESMKMALNAFGDSEGKLLGTDIPLGAVTIAVAGGCAGIMSWVTVFPIDTTKSLLQRDIVTNILRKNSGLEPLPPVDRTLKAPTRSMYRGLSVSISRTVMVNMVFFSVFEYLMVNIT